MNSEIENVEAALKFLDDIEKSNYSDKHISQTGEKIPQSEEVDVLVKDLISEGSFIYNKIRNEVLSEPRFKIGEKTLFIYIDYYPGLTTGGYGNEIITNSLRFNPVRDKLRTIKGVVLTCKEHHKVSSIDGSDPTDSFDGFIFTDENGLTWFNQYPFAFSESITSNNLNYVATNNHRDWNRVDNINSYESNNDSIVTADIIYRFCDISENRKNITPKEYLDKVEDFKQLVEKTINESDFEIIIKQLGTSTRNIKVKTIVPKTE